MNLKPSHQHVVVVDYYELPTEIIKTVLSKNKFKKIEQSKDNMCDHIFCTHTTTGSVTYQINNLFSYGKYGI